MQLPRRSVAWLAVAALLVLLGAAAIVRWDIAARREAFAVDARIAHRLLSQRAAQLDAVLATLVLASPAADAEDAAALMATLMAARLPALWPAVLAVHRSDAQHPWADAALAAAEAQSRALPAGQRHAMLTAVDPVLMQYDLVLAGSTSSWGLRVDARRLVPADEWPLSETGPVRAVLTAGANTLLLYPGAPQAQQPAGLTQGFTFAKVLATPSQPFELRLQRATGPAQWPWGVLLAWAAACAAATAVLLALQRTRDTQRRAAELVRMAQSARLTSLGELAAGMAHELNQPLAAVLASTQAAQRLLRLGAWAAEGGEAKGGPSEDSFCRVCRPIALDMGQKAGALEERRSQKWTAAAALQPPLHLPPTLLDEPAALQELGEHSLDLPAVRQALSLAAAQARRASDVLTRLRRLVQDPEQGTVPQHVDLETLCLHMLRLLGPELQRRGISASVSGSVPTLWADPVMLEQIVHNLVTNAMQSLEDAKTPSPAVSLTLRHLPGSAQALLLVRDNGPGFAAAHLGRVFEPFFSTRAGGLGLGLPLCETLAQAMGGNLQARNVGTPGAGSSGAELLLTLPLFQTTPPA